MDDKQSNPLGTLLKELRERAMLTKEELAAKARISKNTLDLLERGITRSPQPSTLRGLIDALSLESDDVQKLQEAVKTARISGFHPDEPLLDDSSVATVLEESPLYAEQQGTQFEPDTAPDSQPTSWEIESRGPPNEQPQSHSESVAAAPLFQPASEAEVNSDTSTSTAPTTEDEFEQPLVSMPSNVRGDVFDYVMPKSFSGSAGTLPQPKETHTTAHNSKWLAGRPFVALIIVAAALIAIGVGLVTVPIGSEFATRTEERDTATPVKVNTQRQSTPPQIATVHEEVEATVEDGTLILEQLWLDSWHPAGANVAYYVRGTVAIAEGRAITVTIRGTYSAWSKDWWKATCKGTPESAPQYSTESFTGSDPNGPVGLDAEYAFAAPSASGAYCVRQDSPPYVSLTPLELSLDNGSTWIEPTPIDMAFSPHHTYIYLLQGQGFPVQARLIDYDPTNNYGRLRITIAAPPSASGTADK